MNAEKSVPFLAVDNDELKDRPALKSAVKCWRCGKRHKENKEY